MKRLVRKLLKQGYAREWSTIPVEVKVKPPGYGRWNYWVSVSLCVHDVDIHLPCEHCLRELRRDSTFKKVLDERDYQMSYSDDPRFEYPKKGVHY